MQTLQCNLQGHHILLAHADVFCSSSEVEYIGTLYHCKFFPNATEDIWVCFYTSGIEVINNWIEIELSVNVTLLTQSSIIGRAV